MRYYSIKITRPDGTPYLFKSTGNAFAPGVTLSSLLPTGPQQPASGIANRAALNIEFDLPIVSLHDPDNNGWLRVWGLGLQDIGNASNLNGMSIAVYAGMSKGLPLANPQQAGLIMQGQILYAFGNWIGTDQTIDMNFIAGGDEGSPASPANFPFSWAAGTPLATAIAQTLSVGMPGLTQQIQISPRLVLNYDVTGWYESAQQFAEFINELSSTVIGSVYGGAPYYGVSIATNGSTVRVYDGTQPNAGIGQIAYTDLIGQPTWIGPGTISVKTVLRADIHMGDTVSIPPSLVTVTPSAASYLALADSTSFSGTFTVVQAHHYGNFRQADAGSWNTTFQMTPIPAQATTGAA